MSWLKQSDPQSFAQISGNVKESIKTLKAEKDKRASDKEKVFNELASVVKNLDKAENGKQVLEALSDLNDIYSPAIQSSISFGLEDNDRDNIIKVWDTFTSLVQAKRVELALKYFQIFRRLFSSLSLSAEAKLDTKIDQLTNINISLGQSLKGIVNITDKPKSEGNEEIGQGPYPNES